MLNRRVPFTFNFTDDQHQQLSEIESVMYCPIVILVKVSILLQYISIFVVNRGNTFHYVVHLVLWSNVGFYTIVFFLVMFQVR